MMNRFCVITTGRAGSSSFMEALGRYDDIAVPSKQIDCPNNEIFSVMRPDRYWSDYTRLSGQPVTDELSLAHAFYKSNEHARFAGFKTMPNRHRHLKRMLKTHDVQAIVISRRDLSSTIASLLAARRYKTWQRQGEPQQVRLVFSTALCGHIDSHLEYLLISRMRMRRLPDAIAIEFEQLCAQDFSDTRLNAYFGREIRLEQPRPPIDAMSYVDNWAEFSGYIERRALAFQRSFGARESNSGVHMD
jgi:hypothetical protein